MVARRFLLLDGLSLKLTIGFVGDGGQIGTLHQLFGSWIFAHGIEYAERLAVMILRFGDVSGLTKHIA